MLINLNPRCFCDPFPDHAGRGGDAPSPPGTCSWTEAQSGSCRSLEEGNLHEKINIIQVYLTQVHPALAGVGYGSTVVATIVGCYYNVIIAWCIFYLGSSFTVGRIHFLHSQALWIVCIPQSFQTRFISRVSLVTMISAPCRLF